MAEIILSIQAYCKLILHTAKYPHCTVNGILLCEEHKTSDQHAVKFVDCIPLFHLSPSVSPMVESALIQVDAYCKHKGYVIGGYYHATDVYDEECLNLCQMCIIKSCECIKEHKVYIQPFITPSNIAISIVRKISEYVPDACLFMVDNRKLAPGCISVACKLYIVKDSNTEDQTSRQRVDASAVQIASELIAEDVQRKIIDFDNHFDNVKNDWRNLEINDIVKNFKLS